MYNAQMDARSRAATAYRRGGKVRVLLCVAAVLALAGCRSREVETDLRLTDVETGWYDMGVVDGENKLVPSVAFRIQNVSEERIRRVQLNAVFHRNDEPDVAWGDQLIRAIGDEYLAPGATGNALVIRSPRGYTGSEPRLVMLKNSNFVDATVSIFGRHGSRNWVKMGDFTIERELLTD
jgi:hypothetical protein